MKLNIPQVYLIDISNKNFRCQCPLKTSNNYSLHVQEVLLCKNEPKVTVDKFIVLNVL